MAVGAKGQLTILLIDRSPIERHGIPTAYSDIRQLKLQSAQVS